MKLRQISFKIISMIMVFAMMFGMSATTISAISWTHADHTHENGKEKITYVSIGDSMTNGYGLEGYDGMSGIVNYAKDSYANKFAAWLAGYTGEIADNQVIFEGYNGVVDHRQLAMSGLRAEDLNWILQFDETNETNINAMLDMYYWDYCYHGVFGWNDSYGVNLRPWWYETLGFTAGDYKTYQIMTDGGHRYADGAAKILATYFGENGNGKGYYNSRLESNPNFGLYVSNAVNGLANNENYPEFNQNNFYDAGADQLGRNKYLMITTEFYKQSIKDADVITLALGNTNFGTYMLNDILDVVTTGNTTKFASLYDIEKVYELAHFETEDEEEIRELIEKCQEIIAGQVAELAADEDEELQAKKIEAIQYIVTYYILSFIVNYEDVVEYILSVNPDVEIIQVALVNAYAGTEETTEATIGDLADKIYGPLNIFLAGLPTLRQAEGNELYKKANFYFANSGNVDVLVDEFGSDFYKKGGEFVDYNGPLALTDNTGYVANKSTIRDRMFSFINAGGGLLYKLAVAINEKTGLDFTNINLDMVKQYDLATVEEKALAYAYADAETIKVYNTCALYLAIEYAITVAGQQPATLSSLGKLSDEAGAFANITGKFLEQTNGMNNTEIALAMPTLLSEIMINDADVSALFCVYARIKIGDGIGGHANADGNNAIFKAVKKAYEEGRTPTDELLNKMTDLEMIKEMLDILVPYVKENYKEIYADVYEELDEAGYIELVNEAIDITIDVLDGFLKNDFDNIGVPADYQKTKALLKVEIEHTISTLYILKDVLTHSEIDDAMIEDLEVLVDNLEDHLNTILELAEELNTQLEADAKAHVGALVSALKSTVNDLKTLVNKIHDDVKAHVVEKFSSIYNTFAKVISSTLANYGPVAVEAVYNWLVNNPEVIVEFIDLYGDDFVFFLQENGPVIIGVIGYIAVNYGDDILNYVLDNSDVILPVLGNWFAAYGEKAWEFVEIYLDTIESYFNLGLELEIPVLGTITVSLNNIFELVAKLGAMITAGYDYSDIIKLANSIKNHIADLNAYILEKATESVENLDAIIKTGIMNLCGYIYEEITNFFAGAVEGTFTPGANSNIVSVNGGDAQYADLLKNYIEGMYADTDYPYTVTLDKMTWDSLNYDKLAAADLITLGFDEKQLTGFAVEQMLGYVEDYLDETLRNTTVDFTNGMIDTVIKNLTEKNPELKFFLGDFESVLAQEWAEGTINDTVDALVGKGELPDEFSFLLSDEQLTGIELLGSVIYGKDYEELDWAGLVGEENAKYIDEALETIKAKLLGTYANESFSFSIVNEETQSIICMIFAMYMEEIAATETAEKELNETLDILLDYEQFKTLFGDYSEFTVEIPVVDALLCAIESYLYRNIEFQVEYGTLIHDIYEINPDATIVLLGHYNPYDAQLTLGDMNVDLSGAYKYVVNAVTLQPYVYALLSEKVIYVDIYDAETNFDTVADSEDSLLTFLVQYLKGQNPTDLSPAGNNYVFEQIQGNLTIGCDHVYSFECDVDCDRCGEIREAAAHTYTDCVDVDCNVCGATRVAPGHNYGDDNICDDCGYERPTTPDVPVFPTPDPDPECLKGNHYYDDCEDTTCYKCDEVREAPGHEYDCDGKCANCDSTVAALGHVYANAHDKDCDRCGATRTVEACKGHSCVDTTCKTCGATITAGNHTFGDWTVLQEVSRDANGYEVHSCKVCGLREIKVIYALDSLSVGAIVGIVIGSVVVAGAAGFAIFWFLIQKKTFAALMEAVKGLVAKLSNPEAPVAEAEANAPANEEETK